MSNIWPRDERVMDHANDAARRSESSLIISRFLRPLKNLKVITESHYLSDELSNLIIKCGDDKNV